MQQRTSVRSTALAAIFLLSLGATPSAAAGPVVSRPRLTLDGARAVISAAEAEATRLSAPGAVIAVVDDGGNLIAVERLDGTFAAGSNVSIGKARTAALFKKPTKFFEDVVNKGRVAMTALPDFTPLQGGVPLESEGQIVGGVGVSGASSAQQDEDIASAGAAAARSFATSDASPVGTPTEKQNVLYFGHEAVAGAFARGDVLYDGAGRNYTVHASRRERPGEAEVHDHDTDVIYVLGGTAELRTGGSVVNAKASGPGELRGMRIEGGTSRTLTPGDVVVVPNGTPHWFREVSAPFTYFVVKVR